MRKSLISRLALVGLCLGLALFVAEAQSRSRNVLGVEKTPVTGTVPADRPGFGDNTALVPMGRFEAEGGFRFDDNQGGGSSYTAGSGLLLRTGFANNVELRLGYDGYQLNAPGNDGSGNSVIGAKIRVHNATRYTPNVSILPQVSLPTGDSRVVSDEVEPDVHFIWSKSLTRNFSLSGNINFAGREEDDSDYHLETALSIAGGYTLTNRLSGYAEYYSVIPSGPDDTSAVINGGIAYLTSPRVQLDAFIGTGLNDTASNVFIGVGVARLW